MGEYKRPKEWVLGNVSDGEEDRSVSLLEGDSLVVIERSSGPVTEMAYETESHGHKVMADYGAYARALAVAPTEVLPALEAFFTPYKDDCGTEMAQLSDLMDRLDQAEEHYAYVVWDESANLALRR